MLIDGSQRSKLGDHQREAEMADDKDREEIKAVFEKAQKAEMEAPPEAEEGGGNGDGPSQPRVRFPDLSPRAWEHPADRAALSTLRKVPGFDQMLRKFIGSISERSWRLLYLANSVRVSDRQFSRVNAAFTECCEILDVDERPELFVAQTPIVNAGCIGVDKPFIVMNSGTLSLLSDEEMRFVLGHELGHALSGHALYKTMLHMLLRFAIFRVGLPIAGLAIYAILVALREWDRKSELSSDRAGLLCLQDPLAAYRVQMKMAGGDRTDEMDVEAFMDQAREYEAGGDMRDAGLKLLNLMWATHPFPVLRLSELKSWVDDGTYERILRGEYPRRSEDGETSVYNQLTDGARHYRESLSKGEDPLVKFIQELGQTVGDAGTAVWDQVRDMFGRGEKDDAEKDDDRPDA